MSKRTIGLVAVMLLVVLVGASLAIPTDDDGPDRGATDTTTTTLPFETQPGVLYAFRTAYVPNVAVEVAVGDTLRFENRDAVDHTVTSDESLFDSGSVPEGGEYGFAYTEAGTYGVHCEIHPTMRAQVVVTETTAGS